MICTHLRWNQWLGNTWSSHRCFRTQCNCVSYPNFQCIPRSVDVLSAILWHCFYYTVSGYHAVLHRTVFISSQLTCAFHMPSQSKCKYSPGWNMAAVLLTSHCLFWCATNLIIVLDLWCLSGHSYMVIVIAAIEPQLFRCPWSNIIPQ